MIYLLCAIIYCIGYVTGAMMKHWNKQHEIDKLAYELDETTELMDMWQERYSIEHRRYLTLDTENKRLTRNIESLEKDISKLLEKTNAKKTKEVKPEKETKTELKPKKETKKQIKK